MLKRLWIGTFLVAGMSLGCTKTEPVPVAAKVPEETPDTDAPPTQPETLEQAQAAFEKDSPPPRLSPPKQSTEDGNDFDDELSPKREAELLAKLKEDPQDAETLVELANFNQEKAELTDNGELDYGRLKQAADYLRRAFKADENLSHTNEIKSFAAAVFLNEARALSVEKRDDDALKALHTAIEYGWSDLAEILGEQDLEHVRKNPKFADVLQFAKEKRQSEVDAMVSGLFASKPDFKFDFNLEDTDGKPLAKKEFLGKVLLVNIWGTWCPPCRRELPDLIAAHKKYQSQGVEIIGLNTEREEGAEAIAKIKDSMQSFGINYRCALADDASVFSQITDFNAVPMTLFFNRKGELLAQWVGQADEIVLDTMIKQVLQESPATTNADTPATDATKSTETTK